MGAHKHELAFPDTDDVDEDDDEVDTTEDMTMLGGPSLQMQPPICQHENETIRNETATDSFHF